MPPARRKPPPKPEPRISMDDLWPWVVRFAGLLLIGYETVFENTDRPTLLVIGATMIGLSEIIKFSTVRK